MIPEHMDLTKFYDEDGIIIYCGDCLEVMRRMPNECVDLVVTDPPFHVTITGGTRKTPSYTKLLNTNWRSDFAWLGEAHRVLREGSALYIFTNDDDISFLRIALQEAGLKIYQQLHWIKTNPLPSYTKHSYRGGVELAFYCCRGAPSYFAERTQRELRSYWLLPIVGGAERTVHPTQKPLKLMTEWIENSCPPGGVVLDPFMGSGTTLVATRQLGCRGAIGIEVSEEYCKIAVERLRQRSLWSIVPPPRAGT